MKIGLLQQAVALLLIASAGPALAAPAQMAKDPKTTLHAMIDRFSDQSGHLFKRSAMPTLPAPNAPIRMDQAPFITEGYGPRGEQVSYYNLDVQATQPAPIYVFFRAGASMPLADQLNVVDVIPGDKGYNDFWNVVKVTVPNSYVANSITSVAQLKASGFAMEATPLLVNCPIVPTGSTANVRYGGATDTELHMGWYRGLVIEYFHFDERALSLSGSMRVPVSPIYVTFNKNPNAMDPSSGPASGFVLDRATGRTHNVIFTTPEDEDYSPLWSVSIYNNEAFAMVHDASSAESAPVLVRGAALVNCPVVSKSL